MGKAGMQAAKDDDKKLSEKWQAKVGFN